MVLLVPVEGNLLLGSHMIQGLQSSELAWDLGCFEVVSASKELVACRFEVRMEEFQLVIELKDVSVSFVVLGDLGCDLPVIQFGCGSQDDVERGGGSANAAQEPRGGRVRDVVQIGMGC